MKTTIVGIRNSTTWSPWRLAFLIVPVALGCFGLWSSALGVTPAPDGGYPGGNTAEGLDALMSLTAGVDNTAIGRQALRSTTDSSDNTAVGFQALRSNTGIDNTAAGSQALYSNANGHDNVGDGFQALLNNKTGTFNTGIGSQALDSNTTANSNTAVGAGALFDNKIGDSNTAIGAVALQTNTGAGNTAIGTGAISNKGIGDHNIAVGDGAGLNLSTGDDNIYIANVGGASSESDTIRIGTEGTQTATYVAGIAGATLASGVAPVVVDTTTGQLGIQATSSQRFKDEIKPMNKASEVILALKPVTFHYKKEIDPKRTAQFGLVAEEVEKVNPDLVTRGADGKPYTVRYEAVNAMLLNEFLKEHRTVEDLKKEIAALTATVKAQAAQIQKVSEKVELNRPSPQVVVSNQ
jgi:hypothetical protein